MCGYTLRLPCSYPGRLPGSIAASLAGSYPGATLRNTLWYRVAHLRQRLHALRARSADAGSAKQVSRFLRAKLSRPRRCTAAGSRGNDRLILGSLFPYKIFFRKLRLRHRTL